MDANTASSNSSGTSNVTTTADQYDSLDHFRYFNDPWFVRRPFPRALHLVWMACAALSTVACYVVLREALQSVTTTIRAGANRHRAIPYQHAIMAVSYGIYSIMQVLGPLPAPAQVDAWGPMGTFGTCTVQGFLLVLSTTAASISNSSIILLYMLMVRYSWSDERLYRLVKKINALAILVSLFMATYPLTYDGYNYGREYCALGSLPRQCYQNEEIECLRGPDKNTRVSYIPLILDPAIHGACMVFAVVNFALMLIYVRQLENQSARYSFPVTPRRTSVSASADGHGTQPPPAEINRAKSLAMFREAGLICCLFGTALVCYVVRLFISSLFNRVSISLNTLLGFFIGVIYMRGRENMKTAEGKFFRKLVWWFGSCELLRTVAMVPSFCRNVLVRRLCWCATRRQQAKNEDNPPPAAAEDTETTTGRKSSGTAQRSDDGHTTTTAPLISQHPSIRSNGCHVAGRHDVSIVSGHGGEETGRMEDIASSDMPLSGKEPRTVEHDIGMEECKKEMEDSTIMDQV